MAAYLAIFGVTFQPSPSDAQHAPPEVIGEGLVRAADGSGRLNVQAYKDGYKASTPPLSQLEAYAWQQLLLGRHDHWSFTPDLYSDKGQGPSASTLATAVAGGLFGNALQLAATTGSVSYAGLIGAAGLTILIQRKEAGVWHDYALTWNGSGALTNVYKDGVAQALALPNWSPAPTFTFATGTFKIDNTAGAAQLYDELVVFPFEAPASWLQPLATWRATNAWAQSPNLTVAGDFHPVALTMLGKPGSFSSKAVMGVLSGSTFSTNLRQLSVELVEA
jgi:hypothetical protein